jgi:sterol desaturase/sphingolipid hydroxylase (fatty acid hydroxylase superfamily)
VPRGEDRGIRLNLVEGLLECLPVPLVLVGISYAAGVTFPLIGAVIFPLVVALHHLIWNQVHLEMHKPEKRFFAEWRIYKFMARHHFLHHRHPDKNFNVAFPIGDWIFGTVARADEDDEETMRQERIAA